MEEYSLYEQSKDLVLMCANLADDKLAKDILIIDLSKVEDAPADFFIICSCESEAQVGAISNHIERTCKNKQIPKPKIEGNEVQEWVLMDFFDVVVNIMLEKTRKYYKLEKLWGDGELLTISEEGLPIEFDRNRINNILQDDPVDEHFDF